MAEQALYRKYRSADFTQVLGQDHVVKTLTTAISAGRLSHAYLFTGPRGVGKTSVARLLARALNCIGPAPKPCNKCSNCLAAINSSLDVIEMDAASNRSIDAVRDLREKVNLAPTTGQYKVYIIDEVHMLTTEAFNALLKTLEEPPAHAIFILATTEAHKLPETIVSRTQAFSFKPATEADIIGQLTYIAEAEKIKIESEALAIIATAARGGFRDAIGMLDQVASSGDTVVTAATVRSLLGYSDTDALAAMIQAIADGDTKTALVTLGSIIDQGAQPGQVASQLIDQWRAMLLAAVGTTKLEDATRAKLASALGAARIARVIETLLEVTRSHWPQMALETALVKLTVPAEITAVRPTIASSEAEGTANSSQTQRLAKGETKPASDPSQLRGDSHPSGDTEEGSRRSAHRSPEVIEDVRRDTAAAGPEQPVAAGPARLNTMSGPGDSELWPKALVMLKQKNNSLCALLQMYPIDFASDGFTIKSRFNFHRDLFNRPLNRAAIEWAVERVYGRAIPVLAITDEAAVKTVRPKTDSNSDLVSSALEILGGEVIE